MERLTEDGTYCSVVDCDYESKCGMKPNCYDKRLYDKLKEYEDLEEQGLLLKLPCKVGGTVYEILIVGIDESKKVIYRIFEAKVFKCSLTSMALCFWTETKDKFKYKYEIAISEFGKTVFLTKEEAEAALAKMGE